MSEDLKAGSREFRYFCAQINLFGKLALERNQTAIAAITTGHHLLDWDTAFFCLKVRFLLFCFISRS